MIRFTQPADFNDPFELNPCVTHFTRDWIERGSPELELSQSNLDFSAERFHQIKEHRNIITKYASEHGVLSLSATYDTNPNPSVFLDHQNDPRKNLLMWAHYCDKHTGFAIEFLPDFIKGAPEKVIYTDERPVLTFEEIRGSSHCIYLQKSTEWIYENEWRYFNPLTNADCRPEPNINLFKINKKYIKSITFGCCVQAETKDSVLKILKSDSEYAHVETFFARTDEHSFSLDFYQETHSGKHCWSNENSGFSIPIQKKPSSF